VVLLPVLRHGFVLRYDMLFVPQRHLSLALLGISEQPPRQVPVDALVALTSWAMPAAWLEKILLGAVFIAGAVGAGRLVSSQLPGPRIVAGLLYVWNPFVYERLSIGQWSLLISYALLPWVAGAALAVRKRDEADSSDPLTSFRKHLSTITVTGWPRLGLWLGVASLANPYGGVIATLLALAVTCGPPWSVGWRRPLRSLVIVIGLAILANLPWLVPALLRPYPLPNSAQGLRAFAPRSDSPLGTIGSVLSLGGMWNTSLAPSTRHSWGWIPSFALVLFATALGWRWLRRARPLMTGILVAGVIGAAAALGTHLPLLGSAYRWFALTVPGGGLFRDPQKFVSLLSLAYAVGLGSALVGWTGPTSAERVGVTLGVRGNRPQGYLRSALLPLAFALLPISIVPSMAWGLGGRLFPVTYPPDWVAARRITSEDSRPGGILALPWHPHVPLRWNRGRVTLNPALAFFTKPVLTSERLELRSGTLPAETTKGTVADALVRSSMPLPAVMRQLDVRYLLVLKEADWRRYSDRLDGLEPVLNGPTLALHRLTGPIDHPRMATPPKAGVVAGDIITALFLLTMAVARIRERSGDRDAPCRHRSKEAS
jgi:hypothetical protein